jgi:hypothetical protein
MLKVVCLFGFFFVVFFCIFFNILWELLIIDCHCRLLIYNYMNLETVNGQQEPRWRLVSPFHKEDTLGLGLEYTWLCIPSDHVIHLDLGQLSPQSFGFKQGKKRDVFCASWCYFALLSSLIDPMSTLNHFICIMDANSAVLKQIDPFFHGTVT